MSLFVTLSDYRSKPAPITPQIDDAGSFAAKRKAEMAVKPETVEMPTQVDEEVSKDNRSQIELAATRVAKFIPSIIIMGYAGLCNLVNSKNRNLEVEFRLI